MLPIKLKAKEKKKTKITKKKKKETLEGEIMGVQRVSSLRCRYKFSKSFRNNRFLCAMDTNYQKKATQTYTYKGKEKKKETRKRMVQGGAPPLCCINEFAKVRNNLLIMTAKLNLK